MTTRRSLAYRFTVGRPETDVAGWFRLSLLKNAIDRENQTPMARYIDRPRRVCLKGRLGKDSPHARLYRAGGSRSWAMKSGSILSEHASRFDVYVYEDRRRA